MSPSVNHASLGRRLLIIDDDEISLSLISLLLKSEGYDVIEASGGASALELLAPLLPSAYPSHIIADLRMPGLSGSALAAELRRFAPDAKLLAMSATPDGAEGYDGFLRKPLDLAALQAALDGATSKPEPVQPIDETQPVLDESVYQKMSRMMPPAALREVYEACMKDVLAREQEMRAAAAANDLPSVRRIAHTLKGSLGMIGARKLASAAAELELGVYEPQQVFALIGNLLSCYTELHRILLAKLP
jgi:CheY-like chemotaxis protein/HPt (histidine-containing phosphotransfer) domain-containing protein